MTGSNLEQLQLFFVVTVVLVHLVQVLGDNTRLSDTIGLIIRNLVTEEEDAYERRAICFRQSANGSSMILSTEGRFSDKPS